MTIGTFIDTIIRELQPSPAALRSIELPENSPILWLFFEFGCLRQSRSVSLQAIEDDGLLFAERIAADITLSLAKRLAENPPAAIVNGRAMRDIRMGEIVVVDIAGERHSSSGAIPPSPPPFGP